MKLSFAGLFMAMAMASFGQNLQLHYDLSHTVDPGRNAVNFPTFSFEYFRDIDTLRTGSFLLKVQSDLKGPDMSMGQVFTQLSQTARFWKAPVYASLNYSGGLGVADGRYGFELTNAFGLGVSRTFLVRGAWIVINPALRCTVFHRPSYDPQLTLYFGRGFLAYKIFAGGSFVFWTENRDHGDEPATGPQGKKFAFFGDPQLWFRLWKALSIGSRVNVYYHLLTDGNSVQVYPTLGSKVEF